MSYEWDPNKNERNHRLHGIWFEDAIGMFEGTTLEKNDNRNDYGEIRTIAYGVVHDRVLVVVYTTRGNSRRIISARRANSKERQAYDEKT